ncbi:glycerate kinase [Aggregatimonas sangjinii]|uniref:Glycerate kinase n=1 Tax=Aggregatimonas sangjinii TaxID=2583587 RepID=A0A5B7SSL6_9FLAO|nr:glycerate kinase [Aggregatimonas sangjinii]QCX00299.1 glycerate kinase [Aggregatimonas sangjinii]
MKNTALRVLLLPDKFKGSLSAEGVIAALGKGIYSVFPEVDIHSVIVSDGGDGFLDSIHKKLGCDQIFMVTEDPLGRKINAAYLWDAHRKTAYVEMAKAAGLELLAEDERHVMKTSSYGTGLQIKDAIEKGAESIYVGLGGSATNDGGIGIAGALGFEFRDSRGNRLAPTSGNLTKISHIKRSADAVSLEKTAIFAVNDVANPLYGKKGAAYTYGKQKGASAQQIVLLDKGLKRLSKLVREQLFKNAAAISGAGAAGGAAYGLKVFLNAEFIPGTEFLFKITELEMLLASKTFDYIITGEGKLDEQTANGKLIKGVVQLGRAYNIPVIAVCGKSELGKEQYTPMGLDQVLEIHKKNMTLDYSMRHASELIENQVATYFRSISAN